MSTVPGSIPYVVGQWVRGERFYGREAHLAEVLDGPRNGIWVLGTRRVGKTSLLKHLEHLTATTPERGWFPLFWDLQGADDPEELHLGFHDALLDAEERLEGAGIPPSEVAAEDLFTSLARLRRRLRGQGKRLLLLLDEVEELIVLGRDQPALLRKLRHALLAPEGIRSVLASTVRLWELAEQRDHTSPFLHGFTPPLYLGTLTGEEARELVRQTHLAATERPDLDETTAEEICRRADNHPFLLQLVAKRLLETGALGEAVEQVAGDRMVSYIFTVDFEMLGETERDLLRALAERSPATSDWLEKRFPRDSSSLSGSLMRLEGLGFLRRDEERRYLLGNDFFRRWLRELPAPQGEKGAAAAVGSDDTTRPREAGLGVIDGRYELLEAAGEGATGLVYRARDRLLSAEIAVKVLRPEYARNEDVLERFRREILLTRDLAHPNVLRLYHLGEAEGRRFLTMQWVAGPTLAEHIARRAPLPETEVAALGGKLAAALEAAHARGVLHRDVKPGNVLLEGGRQPLLTDFGLARGAGMAEQTATGVFLGTPNYVSPEQASLLPVDERSDLYSLGVVLFEMATGRRPFEGDGAAEVLEMHRRQPPPDPRQHEPTLSAGLAELILRCLAKDPGERFAGAGELRRALAELPPAVDVRSQITELVVRLGESAAAGGASPEELMPLVYSEMRRMARLQLARERPDHTLQPTALVHEAYLKLVDQSRVDWKGRSHFLAVGARAMRRILIDHARARGRAKRGGGTPPVTLNEVLTPLPGRDLGLEELLALDAALEKLAGIDERQARVVELRFFSGLTMEEVAAVVGVSKRTAEGDWARARAWLETELGEGPRGARP